jgi:hypothetical protein
MCTPQRLGLQVRASREGEAVEYGVDDAEREAARQEQIQKKAVHSDEHNKVE